MGQKEMTVDQDAGLEIFNIAQGVFDPLTGFMTEKDYRNVVDHMHLDNGQPWTIPVTLDIPHEKIAEVKKAERIVLKTSTGEDIAELFVEDVYQMNPDKDIKKIFGTDDPVHPGVAKERARSIYRVGGRIQALKTSDNFFPEHSLTPAQTKKIFQEKGWHTVAGFQTRNPIHRAHEYLQRIGMEIADGILIQPLIGWKKSDDFSPRAVIKSYEIMLEKFYSPNNALLGVLKTPMRYAGPREAVFHAIIRRNFGCTHFIVGRDHAGVGRYYKKYEAQEFAQQFNDLGIEILPLCGPYYCRECQGIVTEKSCAHGEDSALAISGTYVRSLLRSGQRPPEEYMRKEIADVLIALSQKETLFVEGERYERV